MTVDVLRQKYDVQSWQVTADQRCAAIDQVTLLSVVFDVECLMVMM